jgi:acetyl esterase/lipase
MPIGYLVTVALAAVCTLLAVTPLRGSWTLGQISWRLTFLVNEQPFIVFYWLLAATVLAFAEGDVYTPMGWTSFGLAVFTALGLGVIVRRSLLSRSVIDCALSDGLGPRWRDGLDASLAAALRRRLPWARILVAPFAVRRGEVERVADLSYGDAGKENRLDVYRHRSHPTGAPTLVYLHGGGYTGGRKNKEARPLIYRLASQGWVCVSANYRLSPRTRFPDQLVDAKKVIAWVRDQGVEYGMDRSLVFIAGSSAGGHLAAMAALTANDPIFQPGFSQADTTVTGAISLYGYFGSLTWIDTRADIPSVPLAYLRPDAPPMLVAHGDQDTFVPVETARHFVQRLHQTSTSAVVYVELPGAQHTFDLFHSIRFDRVVDGIEAFTAWVRSAEARGSRLRRPPGADHT